MTLFQGDHLKLSEVVEWRTPTVLNCLQEATSGTQVGTAGLLNHTGPGCKEHPLSWAGRRALVTSHKKLPCRERTPATVPPWGAACLFYHPNPPQLPLVTQLLSRLRKHRKASSSHFYYIQEVREVLGVSSSYADAQLYETRMLAGPTEIQLRGTLLGFLPLWASNYLRSWRKPKWCLILPSNSSTDSQPWYAF